MKADVLKLPIRAVNTSAVMTKSSLLAGRERWERSRSRFSCDLRFPASTGQPDIQKIKAPVTGLKA